MVSPGGTKELTIEMPITLLLVMKTWEPCFHHYILVLNAPNTTWISLVLMPGVHPASQKKKNHDLQLLSDCCLSPLLLLLLS